MLYGYEGLYQVSNIGNVRSLDKPMEVMGFQKEPIKTIRKGKTLKLRLNQDGYAKVSLTKDGKATNYYIHRLVAECFVENPNSYSEVNHIDANKLNNNVDNLEWCTHLQNMKHCFTNGLRAHNHNKYTKMQSYNYDKTEQFKKELEEYRGEMKK